MTDNNTTLFHRMCCCCCCGPLLILNKHSQTKSNNKINSNNTERTTLLLTQQQQQRATTPATGNRLTVSFATAVDNEKASSSYSSVSSECSSSVGRRPATMILHHSLSTTPTTGGIGATTPTSTSRNTMAAATATATTCSSTAGRRSAPIEYRASTSPISRRCSRTLPVAVSPLHSPQKQSLRPNSSRNTLCSEEDDCDETTCSATIDDFCGSADEYAPGSSTNGAILFPLDQDTREVLHHVVKEFIQSERVYLRGLSILYDYYLLPIAQRKMIFDDVLVPLTGNVLIIRGCSKNILDALTLAAEEAKKVCSAAVNDSNNNNNNNEEEDIYLSHVDLGGVFLHQLPQLRMYSDYINQYEVVEHRMAELRRDNPTFDEYITCQERRNSYFSGYSSDVAFSSLCITPIQRVARYRLLLQMYMHSIPSDKVELRGSAEECLAQVAEVCTYLNESKRLSDAVARVVQIDLLYHTSLSQPGRYYVMDAAMHKVTRNGKGLTPCTVYLMNNIIMCFKHRKGFVPKRNISVAFGGGGKDVGEGQVKVEEITEENKNEYLGLLLQQQQDHHNDHGHHYDPWCAFFRVWCPKYGNLILLCESVEERGRWVAAIKHEMAKIAQQQQQR
eukprot:PhM_4_TR16577/c0_g1_i1/m.106048